MRILRAATRVAVARRNSFEVASFPEESTADNFGWRISLAPGPLPPLPGVERQLEAVDENLSLAVDARNDEFSAEMTRHAGDEPLSLALARGEVTAVFALSPLGVELSGKRFELVARDAVLLSRGDGRTIDLHPGSQGEGFLLIKLVPGKTA